MDVLSASHINSDFPNTHDYYVFFLSPYLGVLGIVNIGQCDSSSTHSSYCPALVTRNRNNSHSKQWIFLRRQ
eukprot:235536-Ditylum_brightwellii.AAC.1